MPASEHAVTPKPPAAAPRLLQLDILRGIAILLVLFRHPIVYYDSKINIGWWWHLSYRLALFGWTGVDLFFVLSGFLIGGLLFQEVRRTGSLDVKRFLIRRGFKIWPPYFVLIAYAFFALKFAEHHTFRGAFLAIKPNLLHLQNYLGSPRDFTWSLSVEEHFYLALPIFLIIVLWSSRGPATRLRAIPVAAISAVLFITLFRCIHNWNKPFRFLDHAAYTHIRIDGLFFGVLLAYLHHFHADAMSRLTSYRTPLLLVGVLLLLPMFFLEDDNRFCWTIGFTMLYLGYGAILLAMVHTTPGRGIFGSVLGLFPMRAIAWVGFFSYSIYLWQQDFAQTPARYFLLRHLKSVPLSIRWPVIEGIHLAMAIGAGAIMAKLIEIPSIALRDRLFPARTRKIDQHPANEKAPRADRSDADVIAPSQPAPLPVL